MKEAKKLTPKQRMWLKSYLRCFNGAEAARHAGYKCRNDEHFRNIGAQNYAKLCGLIEKWIDEQALSDAKLKELLVAGIKAKETKFFAHQGEVITEKEVINLEIRRKYLDMMLKVKGLYAPEKREITGEDGGPVEISQFSQEERELFKEVAKALGKRAKKNNT